MGNRIAVVERVLAPNPPVYLPLVMRNYGGGGGAQGSGGAGVQGSEGVETWPFRSPLPIPEPDTSVAPFESPLRETSEVYWGGAALLALPAAVVLGRKSGRRWVWPVALGLLAVTGVGVVLSSGRPVAAMAGPRPFLSPQSPPPYPGCTYPAAITGTRAISYTYDPLNRLTSAAYSSGECYQYGYDKAGNRTSLVEATPLSGTLVTTYTYDLANRLASRAVSDGRAYTYTWDNRGSLRSDGIFTYTYNAAGQMVRAQSITATLVYTYNGDGLRVAQTVNGLRTTFVWDLADRLPQVLATSGGALDVYGLRRIAEVRDGQWAYPLGDVLGSVRQWADGRGYVTYARGYAPYGEDLWQQGSTTSAWGYTGEWWDTQAQMLYLRARWYAPSLGIFLSRDPMRSNHPYQYAEANPIMYVDPSGEFSCFAWPTGMIPRAAIARIAAMLNWYRGENSGPNYCPPGTSYAACYEMQGYLELEERECIDENQFIELQEAVYQKLQTIDPQPGRDVVHGRWYFDTPFWNGPGIPDTTVCLCSEHRCCKRSEVNYFAQGMWGAASGETLEETLSVVEEWKRDVYGEGVSECVMFWTTYGYDAYREIERGAGN